MLGSIEPLLIWTHLAAVCVAIQCHSKDQSTEQDRRCQACILPPDYYNVPGLGEIRALSLESPPRDMSEISRSTEGEE